MSDQLREHEAYAMVLYERWQTAACLEKVPWKRLSVIHQNGWIGLARMICAGIGLTV